MLTHPMTTRAKNSIFRSKTFLIDYREIEPPNANEALKHAHWRQAMQEKFDALICNETWELVSPQLDKKIVGCKWVFKIKRNSYGSILRYKAWLVAKGFHQSADIDYIETFSPVVKPITVRVLLTLTISKGWILRDINNVFLHGLLNETIFMEQPHGFITSSSRPLVCKLKKALYSLKQAHRAWFDCVSTFLCSLGFRCSRANPSLLYIFANGQSYYMLIYVDDIVLTSSSQSEIADLILLLHA